jgi:signal transduction histidine kinase
MMPPENRRQGRPVVSADGGTAEAAAAGKGSTAGKTPAAGGGAADTEPAPFGDEAGHPSGIDLAKLAHELKTPLSAIAAASEIMKEGRFGDIGNERYAGYIADIHASARHALDLVERMLHRRGEGVSPKTADMRWEDIALDAFAGACLSTVRPLAAAKSLSISERHAVPPARITADATTLKQIVLNLIANAIKFTPPGGTILVSTSMNGSGSAVLVVEDTGPGMSEQAIAEALQPVPAEVPQMREGGGLGLGLPMTRALAEALGATLSIDCPPGGGTRATVTFAI